MTYDELVNKIATDEGISVEKVKETIKPKELTIENSLLKSYSNIDGTV